MKIPFPTKTHLVLVCIISILGMQACSNYDYDYQDTQAVANNIEPYEPKDLSENKESLKMASTDINTAIANLEKIERYRKQRIIRVVDENMAEYGLGKRVFVDWSGPIEPLIKEVADFTGYKLKVIGVSPAIPVIVTVVSSDIEVGDIIKTAHLQAKARADLVVYPKSRTIEVRYFELG